MIRCSGRAALTGSTAATATISSGRGAGVNGSFGGAGNDTFVFDVATSDLDVIHDGEFGAGANDRVVIFNAGEIDTFAELMDNAYQDGSDVVIAFGPTTGIYIKNHTIAQLAVNDFLFA